MWSIQEQEERDFHPDSDLQNAFAWSSMNRQPDDSAKIAAAVAAGKFVVVLESPEYCPSTDAIMGCRKTVLSTHNSRQEADRALDAESRDLPEDMAAYVLPHQPVSVVPEYAPLTDTDVPF